MADITEIVRVWTFLGGHFTFLDKYTSTLPNTLRASCIRWLFFLAFYHFYIFRSSHIHCQFTLHHCLYFHHFWWCAVYTFLHSSDWPTACTCGCMWDYFQIRRCVQGLFFIDLQAKKYEKIPQYMGTRPWTGSISVWNQRYAKFQHIKRDETQILSTEFTRIII